jgi:hypothetical protein
MKKDLDLLLRVNTKKQYRQFEDCVFNKTGVRLDVRAATGWQPEETLPGEKKEKDLNRIAEQIQSQQISNNHPVLSIEEIIQALKSESEKNNVVVIKKRVVVSSNGDVHVFKDAEISPSANKTFRIDITGRTKKTAVTTVYVSLGDIGNRAYQVQGKYPDLPVQWKDNDTLLITTDKEHTVLAQHFEIRSFTEIVKIEYIS